MSVIYWRDIPAQVKARLGRERASAKLPDRFLVAVDGAATRAGLTGHDEYIAEWREETRVCGEDLDAEVQAEVDRLDEAFPPDLLRRLVRNSGNRPTESP